MNALKFDVHNINQRLVQALRRVESDKEIIRANKKLILDFDRYLLTLGIKQERRYKYLNQLRWLSKVLGKPFSDAKKDDMVRIISEVEKENLTTWSKVDRKVTLKRFYKWLKGNDEKYPEEVSWFKCRIKNDRCVLPEQLVTEEDVKRICEVAMRPRDRALVQVLFESGCRISELLTVQIKNVNFDEFGAVLRVTGKTGDRPVRVVDSVPALSAWLKLHHQKDNSDAYVWLRDTKRGSIDPYPLGYNSVCLMIAKLAHEAGVNKRVNPHLFRHSRATVLANKLTEAQMKQYFGWVQGSDMAGVYVHLSGRDIDTAILGTHNLKKENLKEDVNSKTLNCVNCNAITSQGSNFCAKCGYTIGVEVVTPKPQNMAKPSNLMETLMKDPEFKDMLLKKMLVNNSWEVV